MSQQNNDTGDNRRAGEAGDTRDAEQLRAEIRRVEGAIEAEKSKASQAKTAALTEKRRNVVLDALREAGCEKPEAAFLVLEEHLRYSAEDGEEVQAYLDGSIVDLAEFVEHFRDNVLPHVFSRTGGGKSSPESADPYQTMRAELAGIR